MVDSVWDSYSPEKGRLLLHATAVCVGNRGLLIGGHSGSGKSGLALNMIALGAALISDDRVWVDAAADGLTLSPPSAIMGKIEARYFGILKMDHVPSAPLSFCINLSKISDRRLQTATKASFLNTSILQFAGGNVPNLAAALMALLRYEMAYDIEP